MFGRILLALRMHPGQRRRGTPKLKSER